VEFAVIKQVNLIDLIVF